MKGCPGPYDSALRFSGYGGKALEGSSARADSHCSVEAATG